MEQCCVSHSIRVDGVNIDAPHITINRLTFYLTKNKKEKIILMYIAVRVLNSDIV